LSSLASDQVWISPTHISSLLPSPGYPYGTLPCEDAVQSSLHSSHAEITEASNASSSISHLLFNWKHAKNNHNIIFPLSLSHGEASPLLLDDASYPPFSCKNSSI